MSQIVGNTFRSRIPTFNDDASIEEALRVYHYGVDNYSTQPIPNDSIEGNFRTLTTNLNTTDANAVQRISRTSAPNIITSQAANIVPITVKAIALQTTSLQIWQDPSSNSLAEITADGKMFVTNSLAIGSSAIASSSYLFVNQISSSVKGVIVKAATSSTSNLQEWQNSLSSPITIIDPSGNIASSATLSIGSLSANTGISILSTTSGASQKGIVVKAAPSQTANLQEWQDSSGNVLSRIDKNGSLFINEIEVLSGSLANTLMLMGS